MWPNPQETADFVTFSWEILYGKLHFLCSVRELEGLIISRPAKKKKKRKRIMIVWGKTDSFQYPLFGMALENAGFARVG